MDFISGLPRVGNKDVIFVVVDKMSKYSHFMELSHPYSAVEVVHVYLHNVYKLHGWPRSKIIRDPLFLGKFWKALFTIQETGVLLSSAYHPQMDKLRW